MNPAFSVIFLTTLIGAGQGLFIALIIGQAFGIGGRHDFSFVVCCVSLGLMALGLIASFFHLGRPERAWRAATMWRTSWLSREVIVLPLAMLVVLVYGLLHWQPPSAEISTTVSVVGWIGVGVMFLLYGCTGMIYACIKFLQEWASPLTLINFTLLGLASGFVLATAISIYFNVTYAAWFGEIALALLIVSFITRLASFYRNKKIKYKSTIQSAIGIKHRSITQRSMGMTGGSFNTKAFFHHCSDSVINNIRLIVIACGFVLPAVLLLVANTTFSTNLLWIAIAVQFVGLLAERWLFFAQANHPQNLYYQTVG